MRADPPSSKDPLRDYPPEVREEDRRILRLRYRVDFALTIIRRGLVTIDGAYALLASVRSYAEQLFPGSSDTFDLVYAPRFRHEIDDVYALHH